MNQKKDLNPEKLIAQLFEEASIEDAYEKLVELGDLAVPALVRATGKPEYDRELLFSVLSSIETETAFAALTGQLYWSKDSNEQALLAILLAKDGRSEITPWLEQQLPARWEEGLWWRKSGEAGSEFTATILASLICLDPDSKYAQWFDDSLESDNARRQTAAEFIGEQLDEIFQGDEADDLVD